MQDTLFIDTAHDKAVVTSGLHNLAFDAQLQVRARCCLPIPQLVHKIDATSTRLRKSDPQFPHEPRSRLPVQAT
jgi:hypothetical protein